MKKLSLILMAVLAIAISASAEDKFGYVDFQEIVYALPEASTVETKLADLQKQYKDQFEAMQKEGEAKLKDYQDNSATWSEAIRSTKEQELQQIQDRIQTFYQTAQQDMQKQQQDLMKPLIDKVQDALDAVGKENGFTYILDETTLIFKSSSAIDVAPLVKKKLGITAAAK